MPLEVQQRCRVTAETLLPAERISEILDRCWNLEAQTDVGDLLRLMVVV